MKSIEQSDAARLFLDRARRARSGLSLTDESAQAVARICLRLDGIPLSIELAAARCRNLAIEQIARELDDRFRLLTGGARTVLARQQTLMPRSTGVMICSMSQSERRCAASVCSRGRSRWEQRNLW